MSESLLHRRRLMMASGINPMCVILYTTTDDTLLTDAPYFNTNPVKKNTYINGQGMLVFENPVEVLSTYAFRNLSKLSSIILPDSVNDIGNYAFNGCSNLASLNIPDGVTNIGAYALSNTGLYGELVIPEGVVSLGERVLSPCTSLFSLVIPSSLESIGSQPFRSCSNLTNVVWNTNNIPDAVAAGGGYFPATSLSTIVFGEGVEHIPAYICYASNASGGIVDSITFPSTLKTIGAYSFQYARITSLEIPDGVTTIGERAFSGCTSLVSLVIPSSVSTFGGHPFRGCSNLTDLIWNVINAPDAASSYVTYFYGSKLTNVTFGEEVVHIPNYLCSFGTLRTVINKSTTPQVINNTVFPSNKSAMTLYVPAESIELYRAANIWKDFGTILPITE